MNREIMQRWTEALRSGKYPQGQLRLQNSEGFCCLGVLCDISGLGEWYGTGDNTVYVVPSGEDIPDSATAYLLPQIMEWAGLPIEEGMFVPGAVVAEKAPSYPLDNREEYVHLALMNDQEVPFSEIADCIDAVMEEKESS